MKLEDFANIEVWQEILRICQDNPSDYGGDFLLPPSIHIKVEVEDGQYRYAEWGVCKAEGSCLFMQGHPQDVFIPHVLSDLLPSIREIIMVSKKYKNGRSLISGKEYPYPSFINGCGPGISCENTDNHYLQEQVSA